MALKHTTTRFEFSVFQTFRKTITLPATKSAQPSRTNAVMRHGAQTGR